MVKIRLRRMGAKKKPFYRIVVADSRAPRDGRYIEQVGTYNPMTEPSEIKVNLERIKYWTSNGAQPTDTVRKLIKIAADNTADVPEAVPASADTEAAADDAAPIDMTATDAGETGAENSDAAAI